MLRCKLIVSLLILGHIACFQRVVGLAHIERVLSYHYEKNELARIDMKKLAEFIEYLSYKPRTSITLFDLLALHRHVLGHVKSNYAGRLRTVRVHITGYNAPTPPPENVPALMENFIRWLHTVKDHPLRVSADAHLKLVDIHPFRDGNGRTARLFMAVLLLQSGYPIPLLKEEERKYYISVVHNAIEEKQKRKYYGWFLKVVRREIVAKPQKPQKVQKKLQK